MNARAGTPEPRLFFLSRSGADADVALAVARLLQEFGQRTILQDENFTHQDFMAAMERAFVAGDEGAVTVAFLSAEYLESSECEAEFRQAREAQPQGAAEGLVIFRIGDVAVADLAEPIDYFDLAPVLSIEDDARRGRAFAATALGALGLSDETWHRAYLRHADGSAATPEGLAALGLRETSGRADIDLGAFARLADALANEPLALRLASRLLAERRSAHAETYLEAFSEHSAAVPAETAYPPQVRAALLTSFEVVESDGTMQGHSATSLLALAAFTPSGRVPSTAFGASPDEYPTELAPFIADAALRESALDLLARLSLVTRSGPGQEFSVEPGILAVVRDLLVESGGADDWAKAAGRFSGILASEHLAVDAKAKSSLGPREQDRDPADSPARVATASLPSPTDPPAIPSRDSAFAAFEHGEALTMEGNASEALKAFETARANFQALWDAAPGDTQAQADLAASHAKIGLTHIGAGHTSEGERWLKTCRGLIARLARREPGNEVWPRYLESLDGQLAEIVRASPPPPVPPKPATVPTSSSPTDGDTVRRLVNALKQPALDPLDPPTEALNAEEPPPLVIEVERAPPKVFADDDDEPVALETEAVVLKPKRRILPLAFNGHGHDGLNGGARSTSDTLGPAPDPLVPPRKSGFLKRLLGR